MDNKQSHDQATKKADVQSTKLNKLPAPENNKDTEFGAVSFEQSEADRYATENKHNTES